MTQKQQIEALKQQADHYQNLAKEGALDLFQNPAKADCAGLIRAHLIRAESFRTAIKLITGQIKPVSGQ